MAPSDPVWYGAQEADEPLDPLDRAIAELERAEAGGIDLSGRVAAVAGETRIAPAEPDAVAGMLDWPDYTTSLDAALELLDPEWTWMVGTRGGRFVAAVAAYIGNGAERTAGEANSPALALCIAALKLRRRARP